MTGSYNLQKNDKIRSKTLPIQNHIQQKPFSVRQKESQILKIQSQIRKMKNLLSMEVDIQKNKQQLQMVSQKLHQFQQDVRKKRKEAISEQLASIQKRRQQRQHYNKQSNSILAKIKMHNKQRRRKMQSLVKEYKQEYDEFYQKKLSERRELMKMDLQVIKSHQSGYIKLVKDRNNQRIRTQNCDYSSRNQSQIDIELRKSVKNEDYQQKRQRILQLVKKRKQYGQVLQKEALIAKISSPIIKKVSPYYSKQAYDKGIDQYQIQKKRSYKPKLDTNFQGNIQERKALQIMKIENEQSPTMQKLTKLKNLADGYLVRFKNGKEEALDKVCNVNLLRAKLLLQQAQNKIK